MNKLFAVIMAITTFIVSPVCLLMGLTNVFGFLAERRAWWWDRNGYIGEKTCDIVFLLIPVGVSIFWLIMWINNKK